MESGYLTDLAILLTAAVIAVPLSHFLRLGAVSGFLIAGVIVGPSALELIANVELIKHLSELGVVLLLFVIGMEVKPTRFWMMRKLVFGLGSLQVIITGGVFTLICHYLFNIPLKQSILIGPTLALSSTAFVLQLLTEQKMLMSEYGRSSFAVLLLQDLAVMPLLTLTSFLALESMSLSEDIMYALGEATLILALIVVAGRFLLQPVLYYIARSGSTEVFTATALLLVIGTALLTEHIGLSMAMGAFLAGMLIADSAYRHQVMAEIQPFRGLFLGMFFMSMGMSLNLELFLQDPLLVTLLVIGLMLVKLLVLWPLTVLFGLQVTKGLSVAVILAQSGEFALVLFALAYSGGVISEPLFQQLLMIVLLSMLATQPLACLAQYIYKRQGVSKSIMDHQPMATPILIAGFGRVGHRIGKILYMAEVPFIAIDGDPQIVAAARAEGYSVFYGDASRSEVLRAADIQDTQLAIVTLDDEEATEKVVAGLRHANPDCSVMVRGKSRKHCGELRKLGAALVVSENFEASLELARAALSHTRSSATDNEEILQRFRTDYYEGFTEKTNSG